MNAKISIFVICVEVITYLLLYNLHDFTFNKSMTNIYFTNHEKTSTASKASLTNQSIGKI